MKNRKNKVLDMLNINNKDMDKDIDSYNDKTIYALRENVTKNGDKDNNISIDMQKLLDLMG